MESLGRGAAQRHVRREEDQERAQEQGSGQRGKYDGSWSSGLEAKEVGQETQLQDRIQTLRGHSASEVLSAQIFTGISAVIKMSFTTIL